MKNSDSFVLLLSKVLAFKVRLLRRFRYKILIKGSAVLQNNAPLLFLPNHQALVDPIILLSQIYRFTPVTQVIAEKYFDIPIVKWYFTRLGAVRVSDLESGSHDTKVLKVITRSVIKGFGRKKNIVIYPSGQIAGQGYEKIFIKKSAYQIVKKLHDDVQVVGFRINGLWGFLMALPQLPK